MIFKFLYRKIYFLISATLILFIFYFLFALVKLSNEKVYSPIFMDQANLHQEELPKNIEIDNSLILRLVNIAQENACPVCFSSEMCEDIGTGIVHLESTSASIEFGNSGVFLEAKLGSAQDVLIKVSNSEAFFALEKLWCYKADEGENCDSSFKNSLTSPEISLKLAISKLMMALQISEESLPFLLCANDKLYSLLYSLSDDDENDKLSLNERILLYSTLAVSPELLLMKFVNKLHLNISFLHLLGTCGRAAIFDGKMSLLYENINQPFHIRAALAAQLLNLIDDMMEEDADWYFFKPFWSWEDFAVSRSGEIVLIALNDVSLIDKEFFKDDKLNSTQTSLTCNKECFQTFMEGVVNTYSTLEDNCGKIEFMGQMMYSSICANILSDSEKHKRIIQSHSTDKIKKGLLHSAPEFEGLESLLQECIQEDSPGKRLKAVQELKELLSELILEDDNYIDEKENISGEDYY